MKSIKGFITLTGGVCFMMGALATATVVEDDVSSKDEAPAIAEVRLVAKTPLMTGGPAGPTLTTIWDKHQCFVVLSGHCL